MTFWKELKKIKETLRLRQVLYTRMDWNVAEIQERLQAAEKCEILVPDHVPMNYLEKYFPNGLLPNG